jgi:hypothetical protein
VALFMGLLLLTAPKGAVQMCGLLCGLLWNCKYRGYGRFRPNMKQQPPKGPNRRSFQLQTRSPRTENNKRFQMQTMLVFCAEGSLFLIAREQGGAGKLCAVKNSPRDEDKWHSVMFAKVFKFPFASSSEHGIIYVRLYE